MSDDELRTLKQLAETKGLSAADYVRQFVREQKTLLPGVDVVDKAMGPARQLKKTIDLVNSATKLIKKKR